MSRSARSELDIWGSYGSHRHFRPGAYGSQVDGTRAVTSAPKAKLGVGVLSQRPEAGNSTQILIRIKKHHGVVGVALIPAHHQSCLESGRGDGTDQIPVREGRVGLVRIRWKIVGSLFLNFFGAGRRPRVLAIILDKTPLHFS
jgi:hypothetical protein